MATVLATFDDGRLTALLAVRPDLADPAPPDLAALASRAWSWPSVHSCYRVLDQWCVQVVGALCLLPEQTSVAALCSLLGPDADVADVEAALDLLVGLALVMRDHDTIERPSAFENLPQPGGMGPPAHLVLAAHTNGQLSAIARRLEARPAPTKAATLARVVAALAEAPRAQRLVRAGPKGTVELVRQVVEEGPRVFVPSGLYGPAVEDRTPVGWLLNRGLLVAVSWNTAVMPAEAGLAVRGGRPFPELANRRPPLPSVAAETEAVDRAAAQAALRLVSDITAILDDWAASPPSLLKAGGLGIREVRRASKATGRSEVEAARVVDLAVVAGLASVDRASGSVLPTTLYDNWLSLDPPARWAAVAGAWLASPLHLGLAGAMGTKGKPIPALLDRLTEPEAVPRRHLFLAAMSGIEPGTGTDLPHLRARLRWDAPLLWSGGPGSPSMLVDWTAEETELLGLCSSGALATAGRLIAAGRTDEAVAALAGHAPPVSSTFVVQADLTVVAPGELAASVRVELELLADVESKGAATVYRLSESSLRRAFDAGRTADDIVAFLDGHATRAVPQSLTYLVADLGRRFGQVRIGSALCYVRSDDASLLAEVTRSRRTARLGLRLLAPTVAVGDADPATVLSTLRDAGYLPAPEGADGGLVLARPVARRAPPRPQPGGAGRTTPSDASAPFIADGATGVDDERARLAAMVDRLRRGPAPGRPPARPAPGKPRSTPAAPPATDPLADALEALERFPQLGIFDDDPRPVEIAKGADEVAALLAQAFVEDWVVRIAYTNRKGRSSQLNVAVLDDPTDDVLVDSLPSGTTRTLLLERIEWARIMTEAEEELLFT